MPRRPTHRPRRPQQRTDRLAVLDLIDTTQQTTQRSPSERMIQRALQLSSPSVAHLSLWALERDGLLRIRRTGRGHRNELTLTAAGRAALDQWRAARAAASDQAGNPSSDPATPTAPPAGDQP